MRIESRRYFIREKAILSWVFDIIDYFIVSIDLWSRLYLLNKDCRYCKPPVSVAPTTPKRSYIILLNTGQCNDDNYISQVRI